MHRGRHARRRTRRTRRSPLAWATAGAAVAGAIAFPLAGHASQPQAIQLKADTEPAGSTHTLHTDTGFQASLPATPAQVVVQRGDTLTAISARVCGTPRDALALAYNNAVRNPDLIYPGELVKTACKAAAQAVAAKYGAGSRLAARLTYHAASPVTQHATAVHPRSSTESASAVRSAPRATAVHRATPSPSRTGSKSGAAVYHGSGSMQSCIIARESGGNSRAVNPSSGAGGLYQFLPSTWRALGHSGLPENASVAEQNQAFAQEVAQSGYSAWRQYDGC